MTTAEHLARTFAGATMCAFIDDLGRPRLAYPIRLYRPAGGVLETIRPRRKKLTLEVDSAADPIAGSVRDRGGVRRPFAGWLGLAAALEAALGGSGAGRADGRGE